MVPDEFLPRSISPDSGDSVAAILSDVGGATLMNSLDGRNQAGEIHTTTGWRLSMPFWSNVVLLPAWHRSTLLFLSRIQSES